MNKLSLFVLFLVLAAIKSTTVTFYIDHQIDQLLDYVEISAIIKTRGQSLEATINEAANIIKNVEKTVNAYCHTYAKDKTECQNNVQTSAYSITPKNEIIKHRPVFSGFIVAHEMTIKIKQSPEFGQLVDEIIKTGVNKINSLQWKPLQEIDSEEVAVTKGMAQANQICEKIGMKLSKIVSVEEVTDFGEEGQEDDENQKNQKQDQEEDEQEIVKKEDPADLKDDIVYYKFVVQCHPKGK